MCPQVVVVKIILSLLYFLLFYRSRQRKMTSRKSQWRWKFTVETIPLFIQFTLFRRHGHICCDTWLFLQKACAFLNIFYTNKTWDISYRKCCIMELFLQKMMYSRMQYCIMGISAETFKLFDWSLLWSCDVTLQCYSTKFRKRLKVIEGNLYYLL